MELSLGGWQGVDHRALPHTDRKLRLSREPSPLATKPGPPWSRGWSRGFSSPAATRRALPRADYGPACRPALGPCYAPPPPHPDPRVGGPLTSRRRRCPRCRDPPTASRAPGGANAPFVVPKAPAGSSSPCSGRSWTCGASRGGCPRSSSRACRPAAGAPPTPPSRPAGPRTTAPKGARGARWGRAAARLAAPRRDPPEVTGPARHAPTPHPPRLTGLLPQGPSLRSRGPGCPARPPALPGAEQWHGGRPPEPKDPPEQALGLSPKQG